MKKKKVALGLGILGAVVLGVLVKRKDNEQKTETELINQTDLVKYEEEYYSIAEINQQNMELNLTASEAQAALSKQSKQGDIVMLSIKQIVRMKANSVSS